MWELEFFSVSTGNVLGTVAYDGQSMTVTGRVGDMVEGVTPDEVLERYDGWSNGYVSARRPGEKRAVAAPSGAVLLRPVAERDAAIKTFVETNHYVDTQTGEMYEPKDPPPVPGMHSDDDAEA
jgi:hypothetical protein